MMCLSRKHCYCSLCGITNVSFEFDLFVVHLTCCLSVGLHGTILMGFLNICCNNDTILMSVLSHAQI